MTGLTTIGAYHAGSHYENFPVASWLVPQAMRQAVIALYHFARAADDLADEGDHPEAHRQAGLDRMRTLLESPSQNGEPPQRLAHELSLRGLGIQDALDLLSAFSQDTRNEPFATEGDLLHYCSRSANPVGRLVLKLAGLKAEHANATELFNLSDAICTGLQLANFAQDLGQDLLRGRSYIPKTWWIDGRDVRESFHDLNARDKTQITIKMADWAQEFLSRGKALPYLLRKAPGVKSTRLAIEIGVTLAGGHEIIRIIKADPLAVWSRSPEIKKHHLPGIIARGFRYASRHVS